MATIDFVPFATGVGANVEGQATYIGDSTTGTGFASGPAASAKCNKVWRQATFMAAVLATFISDVLVTDVLDDGNLSGKVTDLTNAVAAAATAFTTGTALLFPQASAPTGWTQDTTVNDRVMRVVSSTGGGTGGSWTISGVTDNSHILVASEIPVHTHGVGTLATASDGAHVHTIPMDTGAGDVGTPYVSGGINNVSTANTNSGGAHTHALSGATGSVGSGGGHTHGITADGTWRPAYQDCIRCTKN